MKGKLIGSIAAMLVLGIGALMGLGFLVEYRMGQPLAPSANEGEIPAQAGPDLALMAGVRKSLQSAQSGFQSGDRSAVARALDAARRASEVGEYATSSEGAADSLDSVHYYVVQARLALQNGARQAAERLVDAALAAANKAEAAVADQEPARGLSAYKGATVLNAQGVRIGEVRGLQGGQLVLSVGGVTDLLGFIDFGGRQVTEAPNQLILGEHKRLDSTFVMAPTDPASTRDLAEEGRTTQ